MQNKLKKDLPHYTKATQARLYKHSDGLTLFTYTQLGEL